MRLALLYAAIDLQRQMGFDLFLLWVGKTEIGEDIAAALRDAFRDGVVFFCIVGSAFFCSLSRRPPAAS
jgi:hypothetical protein